MWYTILSIAWPVVVVAVMSGSVLDAVATTAMNVLLCIIALVALVFLLGHYLR